MSILKSYFDKPIDKEEINIAPDTYFNLFNNSLLGIAVCSLDGQFIKTNKKFCSLLGYSEKELLELCFEDITHPDDIQRNVDEDLKLLKSDSRHFQIEKRYIKKTGEIIWVIISVFLNTDPNSGEKYFVGQVQDITNLKETISNLQDEKQKNIHASRLSDLGEMAGGMAHEINNPLQIIYSSLSQLKKRFKQGDTLDEQSEKVIERANSSVIRISKIINSMITFARSGVDKEQKAYDFSDILDESLIYCEQRFSYTNVKIIKDLPVDASLYCNKVELSQVLLNLFNNSYDSVSKEEDSEKHWIKLQTSIDGKSFTIIVKDGGSGIPRNQSSKVFNPFFTTKMPGKGTGLGLSISKGIIESHGGSISYEGSDRDGFFKIILPIA